MSNVLGLATVFGLLLGAGLFAACGGGGSGDALTLEEYFQDLDALENEFRAGQDASEVAFAAIDDSTPVEDVITLFEELQSVSDEFVAGLEGIDPPPEAEAAHEETIAGFQAISQLIDETIAAVEGGATGEELFAIFATDEAVEVSEALDATCRALQTLATDNGIDVALNCQN